MFFDYTLYQTSFQAVIKSASSAAVEPRRFRRPPAEPSPAGSPEFLDVGLRGGCASSRLDLGLENPAGKLRQQPI